MKILVTGAGGLIGGYLKEIMPNAIYVTSKDYDLCSQKETSILISQEKPDWIIHLAARVGGIMDNVKKPCSYYEDNVLMNTNILRAARKNDIKYFTGVISTCAYPDVSDHYPLLEQDLHNGPPSSYNFGYGISKRGMAVHIDTCNEQYGTKYNYVIPCNLYGKYDNFTMDKSHFVGALIRKIYYANLYKEREIELLGTGAPLRQFMYAGDVAKILKRMVEEKITSSFNISNLETYSIREIAEIAIKATNSNLSIIFNSNYPDGQFRKDASCEKLLSVFDDFEFMPLAEGIKITYEHYKSINDE